MNIKSILVPEVNRPEYVPAPEAFLASLAAREFELEAQDGVPPKYAFKQIGSVPNSTKYTFPNSGDPVRETFIAALRARGISVQEANQFDLVDAIMSDIAGIESAKAKAIAASPITPSLALAQNLSGLTNKENPANLGLILEQFFSFGKPAAGDSSTASSLWFEASKFRLQSDPFLAAIDEAFAESVLPFSYSHRPSGCLPDTFRLYGDNNPFVWFYEKWTKLCSEDWVAALPARVWVDWATTILRLAFGMGLLWESNWYACLTREVLKGSQIELSNLLNQVSTVLVWGPSTLPPSQRNVTTSLSKLTRQTPPLRKVLSEYWEQRDCDVSFGDAMRIMGADKALKESLKEARHSSKSNDNIWEAVRYALVRRSASGEEADYYGLLRTNRPVTNIAPGTEWIAVMASLACNGPGGETNLGVLMSDIQLMGLQPESDDIRQLLELAGLARSSADADLGIQIRSAY